MLEDVSRQIASKADAVALCKVEEAAAMRLGNIENAMLKGLKAVSEKAAAALALKLATEVCI
jgi:hypothetical protein